MTKNTTLDTIVSTIKKKNELPFLLEIKHYAKILKEQGIYSKVSYALNDIAKSLGYRKFNDLRPALIDKGCIVDFVFKISKSPTLEMPYCLEMHCELFLDCSFEELLVSNENPYLVIEEDGAYIQYSNNLIINLFNFKFEHEDVKGVFFNEKKVVEFSKNLIPGSIEDLYNIVHSNYLSNQSAVDYDKNGKEGYLFTLSNNILLKPIGKKEHRAEIGIFDCITKDLDIDLDISFGSFSSKSEAEYYACVAEALFLNKGKSSIVKILSREKEWYVSDEDIVFKKLKQRKKEIMGKPLDPLDKNSFDIIKDSLNKESPYYEQYNVRIEDFEDFDFSLRNLSKLIKDGFRFQVLSYGSNIKVESPKDNYSISSEEIKKLIEKRQRVLIVNPYIEDFEGAFVIKEFNLEQIISFDSDLIIIHSDLVSQNLEVIVQLKKRGFEFLESSFLS